MTAAGWQQAEQLLCEINAALDHAAPQQAGAAADRLDHLIRQHPWSKEQLLSLRAALREPRLEGEALRRRLLVELGDHRRNRGHLNQYQLVENGR